MCCLMGPGTLALQRWATRRLVNRSSNIIKSFSLSVRMLLPRHGHVFIDIKLILSVNVFKIPPLGVSGPKNKIFPKPEVNHKKVKN